MPWVTLTSYGMETRTSKTGKPYQCFVVRGIRQGYQGEPDAEWERALFPNSEGNLINEIKKFKAGDTLDIKVSQDGPYKKIISVAPVRIANKGAKSTKAAPRSTKTGGSAPPQSDPPQEVTGAPPSVPTDDRYAQVIYTQCLNVAAVLVIEMMKLSDNFKNLIKKSATPELVEQTVIDFANHFYRQGLAKAKTQDPATEDAPRAAPPDDEIADPDLGEVVPDGGTPDDSPEIPF